MKQAIKNPMIFIVQGERKAKKEPQKPTYMESCDQKNIL